MSKKQKPEASGNPKYITRRSALQYIIDVVAAAFVVDVILRVALRYFNI